MADEQIIQELVKQNTALNELLLSHINSQAIRDQESRNQYTALNELLSFHIAGQAERDASHKKELQLAEERGAAQIAELKLHRKTLHAEILNRGVNDDTNTNTDTNPETNTSNSTAWKKVAEGLVEFRSRNHKSNEFHVKRIFAENAAFLAPILAICPNVKILLANVLTNGVTRHRTSLASVSPGSEASRLKNLTEAEGELCGKREFAKQIYQN